MFAFAPASLHLNLIRSGGQVATTASWASYEPPPTPWKRCQKVFQEAAESAKRAIEDLRVFLGRKNTDPDRIAFSVGRDAWRFEVDQGKNQVETHDELSVYKNGRLVRRVRAGVLNWGCVGVDVARMDFPTPYSVVAVLTHPGAGHPDATHFFAIRDGNLVHMGEVGAENGGPLFRDYDGDGRMEWVFDDYDWCAYYDNGPTKYRIYKETTGGMLIHWKSPPNVRRERLPDKIGLDYIRDW